MLDLQTADEFKDLLASARDLGIEVDPRVRYASGNCVVNGLRIHFLEWGDAALPTLVLVHGGGQSAHSWDLVSLALANRFHIVALDMRGHGDSEWPRDGDMATPRIAEDVTELIAELGLERPTLIGHSLGGLAVMYALIAQPSLGRRAVFVDVAPHIEGANPRPNGLAPDPFEFDSVEAFVAEVVRRDTGRSAEHLMRDCSIQSDAASGREIRAQAVSRSYPRKPDATYARRDGGRYHVPRATPPRRAESATLKRDRGEVRLEDGRRGADSRTELRP